MRRRNHINLDNCATGWRSRRTCITRLSRETHRHQGGTVQRRSARSPCPMCYQRELRRRTKTPVEEKQLHCSSGTTTFTHAFSIQEQERGDQLLHLCTQLITDMMGTAEFKKMVGNGYPSPTLTLSNIGTPLRTLGSEPRLAPCDMYIGSPGGNGSYIAPRLTRSDQRWLDSRQTTTIHQEMYIYPQQW